MEIKCPACGKNSPLGRVLCMHCGERIHAQVADSKKKAKGGPGFITRFVKGIIGLVRAIITLSLLGAIALTLLPKESEGETGSAKDLQSYEAKIMKFDGANRNATSHASDFTEAEINAYLAEVSDRENKVEKASFMLDFDSMVMDLGDAEAEFIVTLAKGPMKLSIALDLAVNGSGSGYTVVAATIGRLPTGPAKDVVASKVATMLSGLEVEAKTLKRIREIKAEEATLFIKTH